MTQKPGRKPRPPGNEGAAYTAAMMDAVKRLRTAKDWSAKRVADEMTAVGVPWTRDTVVNLENGRRPSLRVHEVMALAWILDAESPLDILAPAPFPSASGLFPVTPEVQRSVGIIRAWFRSETGPLRRQPEEADKLAQTQASLQQLVKKGQLSQEEVDGILSGMARPMFQQPAPYVPAGGDDGED